MMGQGSGWALAAPRNAHPPSLAWAAAGNSSFTALGDCILVATEGALINPILSAHRLLTVTLAVIALIGWGIRLL
jgi:hypothetical protein